MVLAAAVLATLLLCEVVARDAPDAASRRLDRHVARRPARPRPAAVALRRLDRRLVRMRGIAAFEQRLREAAIPLTVSEALLIVCIGLGLVGGAAGAAGGGFAAAATVGLSATLTWAALGAARDRRCRRIELQLPAALDLLVGQLRAHRSAAEAIAEVSRRVSNPLREECARTAEEMALGVPLPHALEGLRRRVPSRPLSAIVTAMLVADRSGGNLAEYLSRQSQAVRDQVAFLQEVRSVTAHARATATVLTLLPVAVAVAMTLLDPRSMTSLIASRAGRTLLVAAAVLELVGWHVMRSMIRSVTR